MSHLDLADAGVVYGATAPEQDDAVAKAFSIAADAGGSILWGGHVNLARPLDNTRSVPIYGLGSADDWMISPSVLMLTRDVDTPKTCAIQHGRVLPYLVKDLTVCGPGWGDPDPIGTAPTNAYGIECPTRGILSGVRVYGFGGGVKSLNDHQVYRDVDLRGNSITLDFADNPDGGLGDMIFDHCFFTGASIASIGISDSACLANARFMGNGHLGGAPVAILRYKGVAPEARGGVAMAGVWMDNLSFEGCGHATIWDRPDTGSFVNLTFASPADGGPLGGPQAPGWPTDLGLYNVGSANGFRWLSGTLPSMADGRPTISARSLIQDIYVDQFPLQGVTAQTRLFEVRQPYSEWGQEFDAITLGGHGRFCGGEVSTVRTASEKIMRGDLVERTGATHVARWRSGQVVGVSAADYKQGDACIHASQFDGWGMIVRNAGPDPIQAGTWIMPDPGHVGGVIKASSRDKAIGRVIEEAGIPGRGTGRAQIQL